MKKIPATWNPLILLLPGPPHLKEAFSKIRRVKLVAEILVIKKKDWMLLLLLLLLLLLSLSSSSSSSSSSLLLLLLLFSVWHRKACHVEMAVHPIRVHCWFADQFVRYKLSEDLSHKHEGQHHHDLRRGRFHSHHAEKRLSVGTDGPAALSFRFGC